MRYVENEELIPVLRNLIEQGQEVSLLVTGNSMRPFITHLKDRVMLKAPDRPLKKGDIAFYQRANGQYILHRIYRKDTSGHIWCIGDAQQEIEGPLEESCVFALVTGVYRKGRWYTSKDFTWKFFQYVWINMIPLRPAAEKIHVLVYRIRHIGSGR